MGYDLSELQKRVNRSIDKSRPLGLNIRELVESLNKTLKKFRVKVHHYKVDEPSFSITAHYNFEKIKIDLYICCSDKFKVGRPDLNDLKFEISSTIQHEYIHKEQYLRNTENLYCEGVADTSNEHKYYSNPIEIQAYAHDIMLELSRKQFSPNILKKTIAKNISIHYNTYYELFGSGHPVMKKLLKHCYKFRNVKWQS